MTNSDLEKEPPKQRLSEQQFELLRDVCKAIIADYEQLLKKPYLKG